MKSLKMKFSFHSDCKNFLLDASVKLEVLFQLLYDYYLVCFRRSAELNSFYNFCEEKSLTRKYSMENFQNS